MHHYEHFLSLSDLPGKEIIFTELRISICSYLTIYSSNARPPVSDGGLTLNSIEFTVGITRGISIIPGIFARRRVKKCLPIRELSARHSNLRVKSCSIGSY